LASQPLTSFAPGAMTTRLSFAPSI
jgi:hypothetical protein